MATVIKLTRGRKREPELTRGQKAALTRKLNAEKAALAARRQEYQERAKRAWQTRRANLAKKGLIDADGQPTRKLKRMRKAVAAKVWESRRRNESHEGLVLRQQAD